MENSKGKVIYCEKCGFSKWRDNDTLREEGIGECPHCKIPMKILERDDLVTYEDYQLINNRAFIESQGYTWFDEGWNGWIDYCDDLNKKVVDEYISKLPTFDKYAMYARWEDRRKQKEKAQREWRERQAQKAAAEASKPKCPTCGSTNVKPISGGERAASIIGFGLFSKKIGKSYKCMNCKYTW